MKAKICGVCMKEVPALWKAKRKLADGTIVPGECKSCANKPKEGDILKPKGRGNFKTTHRIVSITPINKMSDKEKKRQAAYSVLRREYMKQHPKCMFKDCQNPSEECHHVRGRLGEYLLDTTEWMAVCSVHHQYIHHNDAECRELGYLKSRLGK